MKTARARQAALAFIGGILMLASPAFAQSSENVLVVSNGASAVSVQIADYYIRKRAIPSDNVVRLTAPTTEQISRADYERTIESPLIAWFGRTRAQDRILYI